MWRLYLLLKPSLEDREREDLILEDILKMWELTKPESLLEILTLLNDNKPITLDETAVIKLYINGIISNKFYAFVEFVKEIK